MSISIEEVRKMFPVVQNEIYLNHASLSAKPLPVVKRITEMLTDLSRWGLPALHDKWDRELEEVRKIIGNLINASTAEIAFVKNTTSGLIQVLMGLDLEQGDNIVSTDIEFPANIYPLLSLQKEKGIEVKLVQNRDGKIIRDDIFRQIDDNTRAVVVSYVEFSTGFRNDLAAIGEFCRAKGIYLIVDGIQGVGALQTDVSSLQIDFLAVGGHKWLLGPQGTGFLYVRKDLLDRLKVINPGWQGIKDTEDFLNYRLDYVDDARRFEESTPNKLGLIGLGEGIKILLDYGLENVEARIMHLNQLLLNGLEEKNFQILSSVDPEERSGITVFTDSRGEIAQVYQRLAKKNIIVTHRFNSIRVAPHFYNSEAEIEKMLELI